MLTPADWAAYNSLVWPAPIVAYAVGALVVALVFVHFERRYLVISVLLASFWISGAVTFAVFVRTDFLATSSLFQFAFLLEGVLIIVAGARGHLHFGFSGSRRSIVGLCFVGYAMVLYPIIGVLLGRPFPHGPTFGVAPCPVTIFTFGMLLLTDAHLPKHLVVIPALWSVLGIGAAFTLGVGEDFALLMAAPLAVVLIATRPRAEATGSP